MNYKTRRAQTHLIYALNLRSSRLRLLFLLLVISVGSSLGVIAVERRMEPIVMTLAEVEAQKKMVSMVNQVTERVLREEQVDYQQFYSINKDESGQISSIVSDTVRINELKAKLVLAIQQGMEGEDMQQLGIPIGNLIPSYLFSARGLKIPVRLLSASDVQLTITNTFDSAGINQTRHIVGMEVATTANVILPNGTSTVSVTTPVPITETLIVGKVPEVYLKRDGSAAR